MSIGTLSRKELRQVLSLVLKETLGGAEEVPHIKIDSVPQGVADRGFANEQFRSRDDVSRNRRNTNVLKVYSVVWRYAKRIDNLDLDATRDIIDDDIDGIERALRNSTAPNTADYSCESFDTDEKTDKTGEWRIVTITAQIACMFKLRDPNAVAEAQQ